MINNNKEERAVFQHLKFENSSPVNMDRKPQQNPPNPQPLSADYVQLICGL